jgi:O-succinylbenzoic acid--CoA ligase
MLITFIEKHRVNVALSDKGDQLRYHELRDRIMHLAGALQRMDIKAGDRIGLCGEVSTAYLCMLYALIYCGAVVVLLKTRLPAAEVQEAANYVNCKMIFVSDGWEKKLTHTYRMDQLHSPESSICKIVNNIKLNQEVSILFTSGSSKKPKAVLHTLGNHYYNALGSNENLPFKPEDRWLLSLPLYHVAGLAICMRALFSGATVVIPEKGLPLEALIMKGGITHISLVPTQLYRLFTIKNFVWTKSLKALLLGGSPIPPALIKKALEYQLPLYTSYGSTEMASQITTSRVNAGYEELVTAGYPLPYRKMKIDENGEILVCGATLAVGYIEHNRIHSITDEKGWFHTGDRGMVDQEGRLTISGRLDNMFISGGENIYPEEIERVLCEFEGVEEAIVVPISDDEFGERPAAFIRWENAEKADFEALRVHVHNSMAGYMSPVKWFTWPVFKDDFKVDRKALQRLGSSHPPDFA